jgi:hypothetical protein
MHAQTNTSTMTYIHTGPLQITCNAYMHRHMPTDPCRLHTYTHTYMHTGPLYMAETDRKGQRLLSKGGAGSKFSFGNATQRPATSAELAVSIVYLFRQRWVLFFCQRISTTSAELAVRFMCRHAHAHWSLCVRKYYMHTHAWLMYVCTCAIYVCALCPCYITA